MHIDLTRLLSPEPSSVLLRLGVIESACILLLLRSALNGPQVGDGGVRPHALLLESLNELLCERGAFRG